MSKNIESKKIKEILDSVTALYNEKVKEEKEKEKGGKGASKPQKAQLKSGKQAVNTKMMTDLMGEDEYGDEDEYDEEDEDAGAGKIKAKGKGRAQEEEFDFMWWDSIRSSTS